MLLDGLAPEQRLGSLDLGFDDLLELPLERLVLAKGTVCLAG